MRMRPNSDDPPAPAGPVAVRITVVRGDRRALEVDSVIHAAVPDPPSPLMVTSPVRLSRDHRARLWLDPHVVNAARDRPAGTRVRRTDATALVVMVEPFTTIPQSDPSPETATPPSPVTAMSPPAELIARRRS